MMGNVELAPEVDVSSLEPLLSPNVVSELLDTYMSTLTVSRAACGPKQSVSSARMLHQVSACQPGTNTSGQKKGVRPCLDIGILRICRLSFWEIGC